MKKKSKTVFAGLITVLLSIPFVAHSQNDRAFIKRYLSVLPAGPVENSLQKYRMTAVYTNRDLTGNFTGKTQVTGEYTRGLPGDSVNWNNAFISVSQRFSEPFPEGTKLEYMENFKYFPSPEMMKEDAFSTFPASPENIFARNLVWDMFSFELFAWRYYDSLKLNEPYIIPDINGEFDMAGIGKYSHNTIMLCWEGITVEEAELCAVIRFNAIDNLLALDLPVIRSKGTEQYWGTILLSLKTKKIQHATMFSGTMQEIEIKGMKDRMLVKTIRELEVEKIR